MLALFAMVAIQAQSLLSEDFENGIPSTWLNIDADNDGYAWMEGTAPGVSGHNGSNGCAYSCSYYDGTVLTPNNWLITPAINLTANADLTFWVAAQDASYAAEHYGVYISTTGTATSNFTLLFEETIDANGGSRVQGTWKQKTVNLASYTGQTVYIAFRHFNCTDMFYFNLDDVEIFAQPTDPTISVVPSTIDFGSTMLGTSKTSSAVVTAYNLTTGITATTAAPFEVSADGTNFGTMATLAAAGGTLYARYTPTAIATDNGTITLASTGATDVTMTLSGAGMDCNGTIPYSYSFTDEAANQCWTVIDNNDDGYTFEFNTEDGYASVRWNSSLDMDDWLISPVFTLTGTETGAFDYRAGSTYYFEKFQVFAIGATDTVTLSPVIEVHNTTFETQYLDLTSLTGNYQIAIHGISDADQLRLYIANFEVYVGSAPASLTVNPDTLDFSVVPMGSISNPQVVVLNTVNVEEAFTLTTTAPYEISLDGTTYAATQTIPANSALTTLDSIFVRFAPTAAGTFNQTLTIVSTTYNETVTLIGEGADCSQGITSIPFVYDFNTGTYPPTCWGYNDADNYWAAQVDDAGDYAMGVDGVDMLVTPEITSNSPMALMFGYRTYLGEYFDDEPTTFRVGYSSTNDEVSSFTWLPSVAVTSYPEDDVLFFDYTANIPAGTKYIAIDFMQFGNYYGFYDDALYIDNFSLTSDATMLLSTENLSFGSAIVGGAPIVKTVNVTAALLTSDIAVTAPANYEVSANGSSYGATTTLPQTGGTLYVRYNPSTTGYHTGNVTLTSGSISKTIAVTGSAVDCSNANALPYFEGFEDGIGSCYRNIDNDGDGYTWADNIYTEWTYDPYEGSGCAMSASYINGIGALYPDNYLITPALAIPSEGAKVSWYVAAQDGSYAAEVYDVMVSTTPDNLNSFTSIFNETLETSEWEMRMANIPSSFNGQNVYVAFRHHDVTDMFWMKIDNLSVTAGTGVEDHELSTTIFPNPANNVLNINANCNINRVEVYNMMGQMVGMYDVNDMNTQINTMSFANGVYTVRIATENGMSTKKFTVAR